MSNRPDFKVVLLGDVSVGKTSLLRRYTERRFEDTVSTVGGTFVMREWAGNTVALWDTAGLRTLWEVSNDFPMKKLSTTMGMWNFNLWEKTAGRGKERFHGLGSMFCRGARAVLLVYDVTNRATFAALEERFLGLTDSADAGCIFALVGNKADLLPLPPSSLTLQSDGSPGALAPKEEEHRRLREVSAKDARDFYSRVLRYRDTVAESASAAGARRSLPAVERACFEVSAKSGRGVDEAFEGVFEMLAPQRRDWCGTVPLDGVEKCRGRRDARCACS